ncbi:hypothetical protein MCEMSE15_01510 [Fimbriimonadaceae bacterium]
MSRINQSFQPPTYWQQFEDLTVGLFTAVYGDAAPQKVGRPGQSQDGVDVFGYDKNGHLIAIQCKRLEDNDANNDLKPGGAISEKFFDEAFEESKSFKPAPDLWILATTAKADKKIQDYARKRSKETGRMLQVWDWDFINICLNRHIDLQLAYYDQILQFDADAQDLEILEVFAEAFQRAAFRTPIYGETPEEFLPALKDVQHALSTGELKDRETRRVIRQGPGGWQKLTSKLAKTYVTKADQALQNLREEFRKGEERGQIRRSGIILEIDSRLQDELERLRNEAIVNLNEALVELGLPPLKGGGHE